ncbi:MAG: hypothetical protein DMF57_04765 [Acidobacteria bacterium]|nr:MAG: hypothetical protein DMF57_04765 [Acidobacteriota bacterium]
MRLSTAVTLACLLPAIAWAQQKPVSFLESCRPDPAAPRVSLSGKVADSSGAPLVGASVALRCGNFRQDARTTGDGTYRISAPAGSYLIEVNAPGFDMTAETVQLTRPEQRDFTLQTGTFSSIITVN